MSITLTKAQATQMFTKLGASIEEGGRHLKISLRIEGRLIFRTVLSRGAGEIPTGTAKSIFREIGIAANRDHCIALRNCPMSKEEYVKLIRGNGLIS